MITNTNVSQEMMYDEIIKQIDKKIKHDNRVDKLKKVFYVVTAPIWGPIVFVAAAPMLLLLLLLVFNPPSGPPMI